jgi:uncharacterized membrane protein
MTLCIIHTYTHSQAHTRTRAHKHTHTQSRTHYTKTVYKYWQAFKESVRSTYAIIVYLLALRNPDAERAPDGIQ